MESDRCFIYLSLSLFLSSNEQQMRNAGRGRRGAWEGYHTAGSSATWQGFLFLITLAETLLAPLFIRSLFDSRDKHRAWIFLHKTVGKFEKATMPAFQFNNSACRSELSKWDSCQDEKRLAHFIFSASSQPCEHLIHPIFRGNWHRGGGR